MITRIDALRTIIDLVRNERIDLSGQCLNLSTLLKEFINRTINDKDDQPASVVGGCFKNKEKGIFQVHFWVEYYDMWIDILNPQKLAIMPKDHIAFQGIYTIKTEKKMIRSMIEKKQEEFNEKYRGARGLI